VELDHTFPRYNPNPEDMRMLHAIRDKVLASGADIGLGFDGDGDRCGVVDNEGNEIFADKVGVMLARDISSQHPNSTFVVDVKSTGLFHTDAMLRANGAVTDYWKTGHSYIKRRVAELGAVAGFEKSGHFFFNPPIGRGYDDGL
ncbi:phosphomannomutase/phosphoglucomutase, partial [Mesorhizobium sp. M7A.T.Ca.TU.009.01.1.2]